MQSVADDLAYSLDPVLWAKEVLGFQPDPWQADLLRSRSRKIILNCSRQSGKSTTCAALGLHESIYRRPSFGLVIAPTQDQSSELMLKFDEFRGAVESRCPLSEAAPGDNPSSFWRCCQCVYIYLRFLCMCVHLVSPVWTDPFRLSRTRGLV